MSIISRIFLENNAFLKKFLRQFMSCEQDVEDIVQEVYIKAHLAEKNTDIKQPKAFMFQIAKNLAIDELSKHYRTVTHYLDDCIASVPTERTATMESEAEATESLRVYCEAIEQLPVKTRKIYIMRKVSGLKHKEIAKKLNISVSSVEKHLELAGAFCQQYVRNYHETAAPNYSNVRDIRRKKIQ
ncbi:RNA polymerase sigma factor (plasmid) [Catenovulum sp. SX2]|uniref:RNA polymerase sigma factor n=1 Tax=Catenovulum sp. SX2 TaxID=3398614 RepID=UPI003F853068